MEHDLDRQHHEAAQRTAGRCGRGGRSLGIGEGPHGRDQPGLGGRAGLGLLRPARRHRLFRFVTIVLLLVVVVVHVVRRVLLLVDVDLIVGLVQILRADELAVSRAAATAVDRHRRAERRDVSSPALRRQQLFAR